MENKLLKALDEIKESYDAFYFINKYDDLTNNTHKTQFELLSQVKGLSLEKGALCWILNEYDCHYKEAFEDETDTAFEYIRNLIKKEYGDTNEKTN